MRLDKFLSNMGKGSRSEIKKVITKGNVTVNGEIIKKVGQAIYPDRDLITLYGVVIDFHPHVYIMLHKPQGVISATEDRQHKTVIDLIEGYGNRKLFPVGRLDKDTEGLILITDDGQFNHEVMAPKKHVPKTYYALVDGCVDQQAVDLFKKGIALEDDEICKPADLEIVNVTDDTSEIRLTITEGKYHQVKRMFEALDMQVDYLKREKIGRLSLEGLGIGEYRELNNEDFNKIKP